MEGNFKKQKLLKKTKTKKKICLKIKRKVFNKNFEILCNDLCLNIKLVCIIRLAEVRRFALRALFIFKLVTSIYFF